MTLRNDIKRIDPSVILQEKDPAKKADQMQYLDRWYGDEEKETQLFLHSLQKTMTVIESALERIRMLDAA